jgi:AcrR family transcriptional regulator
VNVIHEIVRSTDRRREARTEAILDVALAVLARDGIEGLTLARVAQESGVVTTALYRYFPSKSALLAALQGRTVATLHARLQAHLVALTERHAGERREVRALVPLISLPSFYAEASEAMPEAFRLLLTLLGDPRLQLTDDEARPQVPQVVALLLELGALFSRAEEARALPSGDAAQRTRVAWATLQGTLSLAKLARFDPAMGETAALGNEALTAMLRGWGASPQHVARAAELVFAAEPPAPTLQKKRAAPRRANGPTITPATAHPRKKA